MAFKLATLVTELTMKDKGFKSGIASAKSGVSGLTSSLGGASGAIGAVVAALALIGAVLIGTAKAYALQEQAVSRLAGALKAAGGAAGFTLSQLEAYALGLQDVTRFSDQAILEMQTWFATFTNIGGPMFKRATMAALDLATIMGVELKQAAIQLGKALNDPIRGMSAMADTGVTFTKAEKELVKSLMEANRQLDAQKVILNALDKQGMAGAAIRDAKTLAGHWDRMINSIVTLSENIGEILAPVLKFVFSIIIEITKFLAVFVKSVGGMIKSIGGKAEWSAATSLSVLPADSGLPTLSTPLSTASAELNQTELRNARNVERSANALERIERQESGLRS